MFWRKAAEGGQPQPSHSWRIVFLLQMVAMGILD